MSSSQNFLEGYASRYETTRRISVEVPLMISEGRTITGENDQEFVTERLVPTGLTERVELIDSLYRR